MANYRNPSDGCCAPKAEHHHNHFPQTIMSCGRGAGTILPVCYFVGGLNGSSSVINNNGTPTLPIGSVTLDTRGLDRPDVKIDFSALVNFTANVGLSGFSIRVFFQLSRVCEQGEKIPLATYIYKRELNIGISVPVPADVTAVLEFSDPFSFVWCDCGECPGCCTYLVEAIDISSYNVSCASVTNVGITGIASGDPIRC